MIYENGHHKPTRSQVSYLHAYADESFCQTPNGQFDFNIPCPDGYEFDQDTVTLLTLKNVEPHTDPWVGSVPDHPPGEMPTGWSDYDGPIARRAVFWIVDLPRHHELFLHCGAHARRMHKGDWVVFDDRIMHSVQSNRKWYGCAYQILPKETA